MQNTKQWIQWAEEILAIAQAGLTYTKDDFDRERFVRLKQMSAEILAFGSNESFETIVEIINKEQYYLTPKLDIRVACIQDGKILLVQEKQDGKWTLPGGWADVNESPSECAIKEVKEETGYIVKITKLYGLIDKLKRSFPPQIPHAYKCLFLADIVGGQPTTSIETTGCDFFTLDNIPELSLHRIMLAQIELAFLHHGNRDLPTEFD